MTSCMVKMTNRPEKWPPHMLSVKGIWSKKESFPGEMPFLKLVANGPLSSCLCSVEPWLARLDGKCDLKTKMTINQELSTWTRNIFACWLLLVDSTKFTSGLLASLAPFGGQTDLHDLQNNLSLKAIWTPKTTFHGVMSEVKSVALIPTSSKLSLNPL